MSDTGWVSPGTVVDDSAVGTVAWVNPSNATSSDDSSSYANVGGNYVLDSEVKIVKSNGVIGSTNKAKVSGWTATDSYSTYGGSDDLWGETWTAEDINASNFGVVLSVKDDESTNYSHYLKATNFGFSIPSSSTINGISVEIEQGMGLGAATVDHIQIKVYYTEGGTPIIGVKYPLPPFKRP